MYLTSQTFEVDSINAGRSLVEQRILKGRGPKAKILWYEKLNNDLIQLHRPRMRAPGIVCDGEWDLSTLTNQWSPALAFMSNLIGSSIGLSNASVSFFTMGLASRMRVCWGSRSGTPYIGFNSVDEATGPNVAKTLRQITDLVGSIYTVTPRGNDGHDITSTSPKYSINTLATAIDGTSLTSFDVLGWDGDIAQVRSALLNKHIDESAGHGLFASLRGVTDACYARADAVLPVNYWTHSFLGGLKKKGPVDEIVRNGIIPIAEWRDRNRDHFTQYDMAESDRGILLTEYIGAQLSNV